jgi:hypothetical protein
MCWFVISPRTGKHLRQVEKPARGPRRTLYLHDGAFDAFFEIGSRVKELIARHPRPPFEDLVAFVVDGMIPESMMPLVGPDLGRHHTAMQDFWASLNDGEEGYPALLGRLMLREEKYWLVQRWLRDLAVGRSQFYAGKTVQREEWLVNCRGWDGRRWNDRCQGRLRVFSDGTADAWYPGVGLLGFDTEEAARHELAAAGFGRWEELKPWLSRSTCLP